MARYNPHHDVEPIYGAVTEWRNRCLLRDGSVLTDSDSVWAPANLAALYASFEGAPESGSEDFIAKLRRQLRGQPDAVIQLAAEIIWVMLLFPAKIRPETKREQVQTILNWKASVAPIHESFLADELLGGVGHAGTAFNTQRHLEFGYFITLAERLKAQAPGARQRTLNEPWKFSEFLTSVGGVRAFSHILEHLLFPETFERIASGEDKRRVIIAFSDENPERVKQMDRTARDRKLYEIRQAIAATRADPGFDFYDEEFKPKWKTDEAPAVQSDATITQQNIQVLISARTKSRFADLERSERANYEHIDRVLRRLGEVVASELGTSSAYEVRSTSGFSTQSGVRGAIPKDLWFSVFRRENAEPFVGNPQLFMIVSGRGVEYGFSATTHPSDFSNSELKARLRQVAPAIYRLLPATDSPENAALEKELRSWKLRKKSRLEPNQQEFSKLHDWLTFFHSREGFEQGGGAISQYLSGDELDGSDLEARVREAASLFRPWMERMSANADGVVAPLTPGSIVRRDSLTVLLAQMLRQIGDARSGPFREIPELWGTMERIVAELQGLPAVRQRPEIIVKWSLGKGAWAGVPWISLMNRNVTTSTQRGLYIVFLVVEDLSAIYLTLNQGITDLMNELGQSAAVRTLADRSEAYQAHVPELAAARFKLGNDVDLKTNGWRSKNYEVSTVAHLRMDGGSFPSDEELEAAVSALLAAYDRLVEAPFTEPKPVVPVDSSPTSDEEDAPYSIDDALSGLFISKEEVERILTVWRAKKNIILQGAPGVGKSFVAKRLAYALMQRQAPSRVATVQFHQSYAYEDFVQGYRPVASGGFELRDGVFTRFCKAAIADPSNTYVLVIDEINRGNLSKVFGELMLLIEQDKRKPSWAVQLAYAQPGEQLFYVPDNLFIIGMMNTADRSLSMVDYALRRRFAFQTLLPQFRSPAFQEHLGSCGVPYAVITAVIERMGDLNDAIASDTVNLGRGFQIGHSFFVPADGEACDEGWYQRVIETEIQPLLDEYWFDDTAKAAKWRDRLVSRLP